MYALIRFVQSILFPPRCLSCAFLIPPEPNAAICAKCLSHIPIHGIRVAAPHAKYTLIAATSYASKEAQTLVKALKYEGISAAASAMALVIMAAARETLEQELLTRNGWVMVPIPLHKKREWKRGFNQSMLIAEALSHHDPLRPIPIVSALTRARHTDTQTEKPDYKTRRANVENCFEAASLNAISGKKILLIDDVATSGATLEEAARALKCAGAHHITALVFAKA